MPILKDKEDLNIRTWTLIFFLLNKINEDVSANRRHIFQTSSLAVFLLRIVIADGDRHLSLPLAQKCICVQSKTFTTMLNTEILQKRTK